MTICLSTTYAISRPLQPNYIYPSAKWAKHQSAQEAGFDSLRLKKIETLFNEVPATSLFIVVGGKVLVELGNVANHLQRIASVRKSVLGILYGKYVGSGKIKCLYSFYLRDFFMRLSKQEGLFQIKWSHEINEEWSKNLLSARPHLSRTAVDSTIEWMNSVIPEALADPKPYISAVEEMELPDPNDTHVVAAALAAQAQYIVTSNLKDFPNKKLLPLDIEAVHPDDFTL